MAGIIDKLPPELRVHVAKFLPACADILAIAQTSKTNYHTFNYLAYELAASLPEERGVRIALWAAAKGFTRVIDAAHEAKMEIDMRFYHEFTSAEDKPFDLLVIENIDHDPPSPTGAIRWHKWLPFEDLDFPQLWPRRCIVSAPIHLAVDAGHLEATQLLLKYGAKDRTSSNSGICDCDRDVGCLGEPRPPVIRGQIQAYPQWTILHIALCSNHTAIAEPFLSQDPMPPMALDPEASTALHAVSKTGNLELAKRFIDMGHTSWVNKPDWRGYTPIMYAYACNHLELARYLLSLGADINMTAWANDCQSYPVEMGVLTDLISKGRFSIALELLDIEGIKHYDALYYMSLVDRRDGREILEGVNSDKDSALLAERVWERLLSPMSHEPNTELLSQSLAAAAEAGNLLAVQTLVQFGVDVNSRCEGPYHDRRAVSEDVEPPLYRAVEKMILGPRPFDLYLPTVTYLLESGASPDLTFAACYTSLELCLRWYTIDKSDKVARLLIDYGACPCRGTSGEFNPTSNYWTALEMALAIDETDLFEQLLEACILNDDDFLAIWHIYVEEEGYWGLVYKRLVKILDLDTKKVIVKQTRDPLRAVLDLKIVPTHVIFGLLDHGATIAPAYDDLKTAFRNNAAPRVVRALLARMPNTRSRCYRDKQRALGDLVLSRGFAAASESDTDPPSVDGSVYSDMEADPCLVKDEWTCAVLRVFLESGASAYEGEHEGDIWLSPFELAMERPLVYKQIAETILECQPLRDYPHIDASRYIRQLCEKGNFSMLRSVVASANDGEGIIKSEATSLSLAILKSAHRGATTVDDVLSILNCLEYVFESSDGGAFDVPSPAIKFPDEPLTTEENRARTKSVATARRTRALLRHRMDVKRCRNDRAQIALTWLFNNRIDFEHDPCGKARPFFKSDSYATLPRAYRNCILEIFFDDDEDWLRHLAVVYDFEAL